LGFNYYVEKENWDIACLCFVLFDFSALND
jgi:hypothetical protein